jgi:hypothetical protein
MLFPGRPVPNKKITGRNDARILRCRTTLPGQTLAKIRSKARWWEFFLCAASKHFPVFYFLEDTIKEMPPKAIRCSLLFETGTEISFATRQRGFE